MTAPADIPTYLARLEMVTELDRALHGSTWARDMPPRELWESLLAEVETLAQVAKDAELR